MSKNKAANDRPVYFRIMEAIRQDILSQNLQPGDQYATYAEVGAAVRRGYGHDPKSHDSSGRYGGGRGSPHAAAP